MGKILFIVVLLGGGYWAITQLGVEEVSDLQELARDAAHVQAVEELVATHARALEEQDIELLASTFHEDVVVTNRGEEKNRDEVLEGIQSFFDSAEAMQVTVHRTFVDGDAVVTELHVAAKVAETGEVQMVDQVFVGTLRDGKIVTWKEYHH